MTTFLTGFACGIALAIAFILFCIWHSKRRPVQREDEILAAETIVHPGPYSVRVM